MVTSIYTKLSLDSVGGDMNVLLRYEAYLREALIEAYPDAHIEVEHTIRESGVMPTVIEAETFTEEAEARAYIATTWDEFCGQQ